ncbi:MAG: tetratricopeptide repeat protein, partial [Methyloceanibacter sp.]
IIAYEYVNPREHQRYYMENLVYLTDCYQVNDSKRKNSEHTSMRAEAGLPEKGFVFCCFNNSYKITPQMFDIWMRLLNNVENAVLWVIERHDVTATNLRCEAQARGVDPNRLVFAPHAKLEDHLARHRLADLFLDTLPYNAHTTASDALWAGLPVLTCAGTTFAGRVAGSLLRAVGLPELITSTLEEYEALALKLATGDNLMRQIREKLGRNRLTKPLFDTGRFRRHIEAAYTIMWEVHQRGEEPRSFAVKPFDG